MNPKLKMKAEIELKCRQKVVFEVDDYHFSFFFFPTIMFIPWPYRYKGVCCCEIMWLNLHIGIGVWQSKDGSFDSKAKWY